MEKECSKMSKRLKKKKKKRKEPKHLPTESGNSSATALVPRCPNLPIPCGTAVPLPRCSRHRQFFSLLFYFLSLYNFRTPLLFLFLQSIHLNSFHSQIILISKFILTHSLPQIHLLQIFNIQSPYPRTKLCRKFNKSPP